MATGAAAYVTRLKGQCSDDTLASDGAAATAAETSAKRFVITVPVAATAAGDLTQVTAWMCPSYYPDSIEITAVSFISETAVAANGTNFTTFTVTKYAADASGAATVGTFVTSSTGVTARVKRAFTLGTTAACTVAPSGSVAVSAAKTAAGVATGAGQLVFECQVL